MNFILWASISTLIGTMLLALFYRVFWFKKLNVILIGVLISLPLSMIVNIYIKKPIANRFYSIWGVKDLTEINTLWMYLIVLLLAPITEELIKITPIIPFLRRKIIQSEEKSFSWGFLIGGGFGIGEAWYLAYRFTENTPSLALGNFGLLSGFGGERFVAILIHAFLTSLVFYGISRNEFIKYYLLAVGFHALVNISALLYQKELISAPIALIVFLPSVILLFHTNFRIESSMRKKFIKPTEGRTLYKKKE